MSRPLRVHVAGGCYHVTMRGNHRQSIFFAERDRELLEDLVAAAIGKLSARVLAYCWMPNHVHLLLQVDDVPLGRIILCVASRFARIVQAHLGTTGHLFERRYHAEFVGTNEYLLAVLRYIHLNPVRAGIAAEPGAYRWSSHNDYVGRQRRHWVSTDFILGMLGSDPAAARAAYRALMAAPEGPLDAELSASDGYARPAALEKHATAPATPLRRPAVQRRWDSIEAILVACCTRFGVSPELLASPARSGCLAAARAWFAHEAVSSELATRCAVARRLNRCESAIRQLMARYPRAASE